MKLMIMDTPDDPAHLPGWLERHLVGLDLAALVAELAAVHGQPAEQAPWLPEVLGEWRHPVLREGLKALPPERLGMLLRWPALLLGLQELVLVEGGDYWEQLCQASPKLSLPVERGRQRLQRFLDAEKGASAPGAIPSSVSGVIPWYRRPWVVSLATAAALLVGIFVYERFGSHPAAAPLGWGWNKQGALPDNVAAGVYLNRLADAAEEWFNRRPEQPSALARRIEEFRQGCSVLIFAAHKPLPAVDRQWLVERCRVWAAKLDQQVAALEAGRDPLQVRADVDDTVNRLIEALRTKAKEVA
jgi:hypothetical protein